nr:M23 family metallopeptidase [Candidatus Levybacteria bacterium]
MVCDADVELRIKNQELGIDDTLSTGNGRIVVNPDCSVKDYTLKPDYEASYQVQNAGFYDLTLTAQTNNGIYSITDSFEVRESVPFDVERITATRIFPVNTYPVTINITANQDFQGVITEAVPGDFAVEQSPQSDIPFTQTQNISQTAIGQLIGASSSAKLGLPFSGDYPISLEFGEKLKNEYEKNLYQQFNLAGHDGVDFDMPVGTPILAADDGTVVMAGGEIYGTTVVIQHSWGRSYYGHLSKTNVIMGQKVSKGEEIALSGNTGFTTGPHLHFGIKPNSTNIDNGYYGKIDPLPFLGIESKLDSSKLTKVISWSANLKKGDKLKLEYIYKAPNISPQFYKLGFLRFFENSSNIFEETRQWQIAVDAPNNQFVKVGSFTKKTSTGSQSVTGIGFKPKAIIFYWTNQTANGTVSEGSNVAGSQGMGFATGSANEAALSGWDEGQTAATTLDNGRATYNNASIVIQGNLGALTLGVADFTSFDPDGFTLNWSVADANAYIIYYYALSETIVSNATVNSFSFTTGTGNLSVTNAGFQPDFVLFMTGGTTTHGSNTANGMIFTIGAASSSTSEWTTAAYSTEAVSAADLSDDCAWQRTDASIALIGTTVACGTTTEDALADFTQFTSTGFDINKSNAPAGAFDVFYLALKGNATSFSVGSFNKPTATGNNSVSISNFQPAGLMLASRSMVSSTTVDSGSATAGIFSMGATSGLSQEGAISRAGIDNVDASTPDFRTSSTKAISAVKGDGTLTGEANLASFDSSGFTLKWTTADATADQYLYWSIGEILTPPDLMRHGKWFHNGVEQPFAF